jgi:hypothetical protein
MCAARGATRLGVTAATAATAACLLLAIVLNNPNTAQHFSVENAADKSPIVMLKQLNNGEPAQIVFTSRCGKSTAPSQARKHPDFHDFRTGVSMYYEPKGTMEKPRVEDLYGAKLPPIPKPYHRKPRTVKNNPKELHKTNYSK